MLMKENIPIKVNDDLDHIKISRVTIRKRSVIPPNSVGYVGARLQTKIVGPYVVEPLPLKHALVSSVYGEGESLILKVVNDSDTFVTFRKGKIVGNAESADLVGGGTGTEVYSDNQNTVEPNTVQPDLPDHLVDMYEKACVDLSDHECAQFKRLLSEFPSVFASSDMDLGCLKGVEHNIETIDNIPVNEKIPKNTIDVSKTRTRIHRKLTRQKA